MDTSETYIKMMGGAWADLKKDMPIWAMLFSRRLRMLYVLDGEVVHWREKVNTSNHDRAFPLLEQDQLQEMWAEGNELHRIGAIPGMVQIIWKYMKANLDYIDSLGSMEQLWLAFIMKEKYNKVWDGEKWVKE